MKIQFYLNEILTDALTSKGEVGDSPHLIAKGLIEEILKGDRQSSPMPPDLGDRLESLDRRVEFLNEIHQTRWSELITVGDRLTNLEKRLTLTEEGEERDRLEKLEKHLDWAKREILDHRQKLKDFEHQAHWGGDKIQETAIMVQKQPLPPAEIPLKTQIALRTEIARTHEEVALAWEKSLTTVKRWAKNPDKWPEGWIWDGDQEFWFKKV